jgi:solute carrier family 25 phosphate transporter 23/24/25/41
MDGESQKEQDARVERLWQTLDTAKDGHLDLKGLKKGLKKIDHRWS